MGAELLEHMPVKQREEDVYDDYSEDGDSAPSTPVQKRATSGESAPPPKEEQKELLSLVSEPTPPANDILSGILSGEPASHSPAPTSSPAGSFGSANSGIPSITAFEKSGVKIQFAFMKQPGQQHVTLINAIVTNATPTPLNNFTIQVAVPQYMKVQMGQTSG